mgnify:CR=1 FL=1
MSFYDLECEIDARWGGNEPPRQSRAKVLLALYSLQEMSPEARLAKSERLEAVFAKIKADWAADGFVEAIGSGGLK